ncbi:MAG: hypothetical protein ACRER3_05790 [Pseudomonas fluorescens]
MTFILKKKDPLDVVSTRWIEPAPGLRLQIGSSARPGYTSDFRQIQRHLEFASRQMGVGTEEFDILKKSTLEIPDPDILFVELACKHLILDWEGVAEAEDPNTPAPYTPERGVVLVEQMPEIYFLVLKTANDIALRQEEQITETVEKPLPPTAGQQSGRGRKTTAKDKSTKG